MHIEYDLTLDDLVAQNVFNTRRSRTLRAQYLQTLAAMPFVVFFVVFFFTRDLSKTLLDGLALTVFWFMYYPYAYRTALRRNLASLVQDSGSDVSVGQRSLTLTPEGIVERTQASELFWRWGVVDGVHEDEGHVYICGTSNVSHAVPKRAFADDEEKARFRSSVSGCARRSVCRLPGGRSGLTAR